MRGALDSGRVVRRHLLFGWWSLFLFLVLGFLLEGLHAFKVGWYVDVSSQTRRLMWTLAHAHGTLLALVHLAFATTLRTARRFSSQPISSSGTTLSAARRSTNRCPLSG